MALKKSTRVKFCTVCGLPLEDRGKLSKVAHGNVNEPGTCAYKRAQEYRKEYYDRKVRAEHNKPAEHQADTGWGGGFFADNVKIND